MSVFELAPPQSHFALHHNLSDVSAKESSQETAVTLCGLLAGLAVATWFRLTPAQAWAAFLLITALHVYANVSAVRCLALRTLNQNRAGAAVGAFLEAEVADVTPEAVAAVEPLWPGSIWGPSFAQLLPAPSWLCALPLTAPRLGVTLRVASCTLLYEMLRPSALCVCVGVSLTVWVWSVGIVWCCRRPCRHNSAVRGGDARCRGGDPQQPRCVHSVFKVICQCVTVVSSRVYCSVCCSCAHHRVQTWVHVHTQAACVLPGSHGVSAARDCVCAPVCVSD